VSDPILRFRVLFVIALLLISGGTLWGGYAHIGRTPQELMDYAERRLEGHPKLELIALPVIGVARQYFNAPSPKDRRKMAFYIPPPPPLIIDKAAENPPLIQPGHPGAPRIWRVGPGQAISRISDAARMAKDGDIVEILAGEYFGDVATWPQKKLTILGIGGNARIYANNKSAQGKSIWVINGAFDIQNIDFIGAHVEDKNGAGIRFESGHLKIRNCLFYANQNGLLTAAAKDATLEIENSEFAYNGIGDGLSHNLYVGPIKSLKVTGSYFHHANVGHLLKSRAANNLIAYNRLTDENGGTASYEMNFPNGGIVVAIGNIIQQNRETENSAMIAYGEEKNLKQKNALYLVNNTLVNDHPHGGAFLRAAPGTDQIVSANNLLIGPGKYHAANPIDSSNDIHAGWNIFTQPSRYDYHLNPQGKKLAYRAKPVKLPAMDDSFSYPLQFEYVHPRMMKPLPAPLNHPGALQS
jgi:hypothetical protein